MVIKIAQRGLPATSFLSRVRPWAFAAIGVIVAATVALTVIGQHLSSLVRKQIIQGLKDNHDGRNSVSYKVCLVARRPERGGENSARREIHDIRGAFHEGGDSAQSKRGSAIGAVVTQKAPTKAE
jgi:hypothetical protein